MVGAGERTEIRHVNARVYSRWMALASALHFVFACCPCHVNLDFKNPTGTIGFSGIKSSLCVNPSNYLSPFQISAQSVKKLRNNMHTSVHLHTYIQI